MESYSICPHPGTLDSQGQPPALPVQMKSFEVSNDVRRLKQKVGGLC